MHAAIQEFGQRMGMEDLAPDASGSLALALEDLGELHLERSSDSGTPELMLYLTRPVPACDAALAGRALAFCHYAGHLPWQVWGGVYRDTLVLVSRLAEERVTAQDLLDTAQFLIRGIEQITRSGSGEAV